MFQQEGYQTVELKSLLSVSPQSVAFACKAVRIAKVVPMLTPLQRLVPKIMGLEAQEMRGKTLNYLPSKQGVLLENGCRLPKDQDRGKKAYYFRKTTHTYHPVFRVLIGKDKS